MKESFNISEGAQKYLNSNGKVRVIDLMDFHTERMDRFQKSPVASLDKHYMMISGKDEIAIVYMSIDDEYDILTIKEFGEQWWDLLQVAAGEHMLISLLWDTE